MFEAVKNSDFLTKARLNFRTSGPIRVFLDDMITQFVHGDVAELLERLANL